MQTEICTVQIDNAIETDPGSGKMLLKYGEITNGDSSRMIQRNSEAAMSMVTQDIRDQSDAIQAIFREMQKKRKHIDTTDLMVEINSIINENVEIEEQKEGQVESRQFDISQIDFDLLAVFHHLTLPIQSLLIQLCSDVIKIRINIFNIF